MNSHAPPPPGRLRLIARTRDQRRRERLGGQIGGRLGIARAALEEAQQRPRVTVVEPAEILKVAGAQQGIIGGRVHVLIESNDGVEL